MCLSIPVLNMKKFARGHIRVQGSAWLDLWITGEPWQEETQWPLWLACNNSPADSSVFLQQTVQPSCMGSGSFRGMLDGGSRKGVSESQDRRGDSWKWSDNGSLPPVLMVMAINVDSQSHECKVCREFLCRYLIVNAVGQPIVEGIE